MMEMVLTVRAAQALQPVCCHQLVAYHSEYRGKTFGVLSGCRPEAKFVSFFCVSQNTMGIIHWEKKNPHRHYAKGSFTGGPTETAQLQPSWLDNP